MKLTPEQKSENARQKTLDAWKAFSLQTCVAKTATVFQRMIRAEDAADEIAQRYAVISGNLMPVKWHRGYCTCITCGAKKPWNVKGMHTGHWIGRVHRSTLLDPDNVAPQCYYCNEQKKGAALEYHIWMLSVRGRQVMERLQALKHQPTDWTREQLVDMRIEFSRRLKAAEAKMKGT